MFVLACNSAKRGPGSDHAVPTGIKFGLDRILDSGSPKALTALLIKKKTQIALCIISYKQARLVQSLSHRETPPVIPLYSPSGVCGLSRDSHSDLLQT